MVTPEEWGVAPLLILFSYSKHVEFRVVAFGLKPWYMKITTCE
jgi:hypothetical protein